jgi:hypothetical protein
MWKTSRCLGCKDLFFIYGEFMFKKIFRFWELWGNNYEVHCIGGRIGET